MAIRRTRADKLKSQLRRNQTTFSWQPSQTAKSVQTLQSTKLLPKKDHQEVVFLKRDLRQTALALAIVLLLLFLIWRFW